MVRRCCDGGQDLTSGERSSELIYGRSMEAAAMGSGGGVHGWEVVWCVQYAQMEERSRGVWRMGR